MKLQQKGIGMKTKWMMIGILFAATGYSLIAGDTGQAGGNFMSDMDTSMKRMDKDMTAAPMTGNVDHDFAAMMIPHHQGAIDMAKGELIYGKDPVMRRLAQEIIADQQSEIDLMNLWLKKHAETAQTK